MEISSQLQPALESLFRDIQKFANQNGRLAEKAVSIEAAVTIAEQMFLPPVTLEASFDPEEPLQLWIVINARAAGDSVAIRQQRLAWHARLRDSIGADAFAFRICIVPESL